VHQRQPVDTDREIVICALPAARAAAASYCRWTLSRDHRLVTVYGPEGWAWVKVAATSGVRTSKIIIDESSGVKLFKRPHPARKISVSAQAFIHRSRHRCARP
jgi:hypothetical protein